MRKLVYYVATTADGFIATTDGSFDVFMQRGEHMADLFARLPETVLPDGVVPLGRVPRPVEAGAGVEVEGAEGFEDVRRRQPGV